MKQYITKKQLSELSEKGKKKLRKWWKPNDLDIYYSESYSNKPIIYEERFGLEYENEALPLLSIGQMIEFLEDANAGTSLLIEHWSPDYESDPFEWTVKFRKKDYGDNNYELADVLWEAVKSVLRTNKEK